MAKLIYAMVMSLDGYTEDAQAALAGVWTKTLRSTKRSARLCRYSAPFSTDGRYTR